MHNLNCHTAPIALFDSGAGGIGVLREVQKLLPSEQLLYFGDTKNAPYGERTTAEIRTLVLDATATLIPHAKALVLACNTATAAAAAHLRAAYPSLPILGMEPALAPAVRAASKSKPHPHILVLATAATLREQKFAMLCEKYAKTATVRALSAPGIVRLVEAGLADSPEMDAYLNTLKGTLSTLPDAIVLGCTHFPFAKNAIIRVFGHIPFFDGAAGTAMELKRRLGAADLLAPAHAVGGVSLFSSDPRSLPLLTGLYKR